MRRFVFRFGYCTPGQAAANDANGWDDESSGAFIVEAPNADDALRWGRQVADGFVAHLFKEGGVLQLGSWNDAKFANWLDDEPERSFTPDALQALRTVVFGQMPSFAGWT